MKCSVCLLAPSVEAVEDAVTILNGQAVCLDHAGIMYGQGDRFTKGLMKVRRQALLRVAR